MPALELSHIDMCASFRSFAEFCIETEIDIYGDLFYFQSIWPLHASAPPRLVPDPEQIRTAEQRLG